MTQWLRQSTAATIKFGPFVDDADGKSAETALSIAQADIRLTKNGGDVAQTHNAAGATHDENGYYDVPLDTTDTAMLGRLRVFVSKTGALPVWQDFVVVAANVFDSLIGGGDVLDVSLIQLLGTAPTEGAAGRLAAALTKYGDVATPVMTAASVNQTMDNIAAAALVDLIWDEVNNAAAHNTQNSTGRQLRNVGSPPSAVIRSGTCQAGSTSTTIKLDSGASATNSIYNGNTVYLDGGVGIGQSRRIVAYVGSTKIATIDRAWTVTPTNTSTFTMVASPVSIMSFEGIAASGANSTVVLASIASAVNNFYSGMVVIESGTGAGQAAEITGYTGDSRTVSIAPATWSVNPASDSVVAIIPMADTAQPSISVAPTADEITSAVWSALLASFAATGTAGKRLLALPEALPGALNGLPTLDSTTGLLKQPVFIAGYDPDGDHRAGLSSILLLAEDSGQNVLTLGGSTWANSVGAGLLGVNTGYLYRIISATPTVITLDKAIYPADSGGSVILIPGAPNVLTASYDRAKGAASTAEVQAAVGGVSVDTAAIAAAVMASATTVGVSLTDAEVDEIATAIANKRKARYR